jgi:hypothetical protein
VRPPPERQPDLPLLVWESGDLHAFGSVTEAESALEPPDVKSGIYKGFDAAGRLLKLGVAVQREKFLGIFTVARERVSVALAEDSPTHRDELAGILTGFLKSVGTAADAVAKMTFEQLVAAASQASDAVR